MDNHDEAVDELSFLFPEPFPHSRRERDVDFTFIPSMKDLNKVFSTLPPAFNQKSELFKAGRDS